MIRNVKLILMLLAFLPLCAIAQGNWNDALYKQIEQNVKEPVFKDKTYDVTKYGASVNATAAKNQKAINKAIEACSKAGGGKVVIPAGTYHTGALRLKSNVNLEIQKDAKLQFVFDKELYPVVKTRWEGMDCMNLSPCIYAYGEKNIAITGEGTVDGGGSNDTWWNWCGKDHFGYKPEQKESQKIGRPGCSSSPRPVSP